MRVNIERDDRKQAKPKCGEVNHNRTAHDQEPGKTKVPRLTGNKRGKMSDWSPVSMGQKSLGESYGKRTSVGLIGRKHCFKTIITTKAKKTPEGDRRRKMTSRGRRKRR
jgi:hypothetical protein